MNDENNETIILDEIKKLQQKYKIKQNFDLNEWFQYIFGWIEIYKEEDKALLKASREKNRLQNLIKKANAFNDELQAANAIGIEIFPRSEQPFCENQTKATHDILACPVCSKSRNSDYDLAAMQNFIQKFISDTKIKESSIPIIGKGRPTKKITYRLIALLGRMYQEITGEKVLFYWSNYSVQEQYIGNFDVFVRDILGALEILDPSLPIDIGLYKMKPNTLSDYIKRYIYEIYPKWLHKNQ
jgi:hypothetical protein